MPIAMSCAGLVGGVLGMIFVALVTIHCMHLLVSSAQKLVREKYGSLESAEIIMNCPGSIVSSWTTRTLLRPPLCPPEEPGPSTRCS